MGVAKYQKDKKDGIQEVLLQSGIKVKPVYTPEDLEAAGFQYERDLADPGTTLLLGVSTPWVTAVGPGLPGNIPASALRPRPMNGSS